MEWKMRDSASIIDHNRVKGDLISKTSNVHNWNIKSVYGAQMIALFPLQIRYRWIWEMGLQICLHSNRAVKIGWIINNAASHLPIMLKYYMLVHYWCQGAAEVWKSNSDQIQDVSRRPKFQYLNRHNSAADCSASHKLGIEFDHMTAIH